MLIYNPPPHTHTPLALACHTHTHTPGVVKKGVGSKPAIVGNKLTTTYCRGENYFEVDVDVNSTSVGVAIFKLVTGYVKNLVLDLCFVIQGNSTGELPEHVLGGVRLSHVDMDILANIDDPVDSDAEDNRGSNPDDADDTDDEGKAADG